MELEQGVCIENVTAWLEAIEKCRRTLPYEKWYMLRHELKCIGILVPERPEVTLSNELLEECCSICCDHHHKTDSVRTSCGHCFGKECFEKWENVQNEKESEIICPMCRTNVKYIINNQTHRFV
jgi:hypothetical protein